VLSFTRLWNVGIVPADEGRLVTQHFVADVFHVRESDLTHCNTGFILILTSVTLKSGLTAISGAVMSKCGRSVLLQQRLECHSEQWTGHVIKR